MIELSIIVPIYKVEKYLERCINSLTNQTLKNIEIILVDDGSPDRCPQICDNWIKKDARIKVIHKNNGGLSSARNAGLRIAQGKYIGFVDSDDDIELDMYEKMYDICERYNVDFAMCDYQRKLSNGKAYLKTLNIDGGYYSKEKIIKDIFPSLIMSSSIEYGPILSVCNCLYNSNFLRKNNLKFDEEVKWSEDNIFSAFVGYYANSFYYLKNEGLYYYHQNENSITTSYRYGAWNVYKIMNKHMHDFFDKVKDYDFSQQLYYHLIYYGSNCMNTSCFKKKFLIIKKDISLLLSDCDLQEALKKAKNLDIPAKLKLQLWLMRHNCSFLLSLIVMKRG